MESVKDIKKVMLLTIKKELQEREIRGEKGISKLL